MRTKNWPVYQDNMETAETLTRAFLQRGSDQFWLELTDEEMANEVGAVAKDNSEIIFAINGNREMKNYVEEGKGSNKEFVSVFLKNLF